jgi:hypothetical protein
MSRLIVTPNLADPDGVYERLVRLQEEVGDAGAARVNARLILLLVNHIGDGAVIEEAIALARRAPGGAKYREYTA